MVQGIEDRRRKAYGKDYTSYHYPPSAPPPVRHPTRPDPTSPHLTPPHPTSASLSTPPSTHTPAPTMDVDSEVTKLVEEITRLGDKGPDGKVSVKFVKLIDDDRCGNIFEAIIGTLKAARRSNVLTFEGEFLLKGVHDDVDITLL
ncbi:unnamed protein product [Chondrus crispus]|uniref:Costars domain-containing protein n=1 Tax=Chondrus crispus TaxID=2769 RepID=R7Q2T6_CHOCR|nr:unnamed protein product [Chondrus crispus]CDF32203.1 unnamed protein product [Chondrus crispus]|eukprot:XP_005711868.1 unnamed protein product [Chondrus crispus]